MAEKISSYPLLYSLVKELENSKDEIIFKWLHTQAVTKIFGHHKISIEKFMKNYAPDIIQHFIKIVQDLEKPGDCPTMSKFLSYMLSKGIAPHEIHEVCTTLRTQMIRYVLSLKKYEHKKYLAILDEFLAIFDANLTGVLTLFHDYIQRQTTLAQKSLEYKRRIDSLTHFINALDVKVCVVQSGTVIMANSHLLDSLGLKDLEELHDKYAESLSFLKEISFQRELFTKDSYERWMELAMDFQEHISATILNLISRKETNYSISVNALVETTPVKYVLTLQESFVNALKSDSNISEVDKLTGLTSYLYYKSYIQEFREQLHGHVKALVVVDIRLLRDVNESQGFDKGDKLIMECAKKVVKTAPDTSKSIRLSGSRIGILLGGRTLQELYDWSVVLRCELNKLSEKIFVSITELKDSESSNEYELRAYNLLNSFTQTKKNHVLTDIEDIELYDLLENQKMFIERFSKLNEELEAALLYNEIIVRSKHRIVRVSQNSIYIKVNNKQLFMAKIDDFVYLQADSLGDIRASIKSINSEKSLLELNRFIFDEHTPLKRKMLRVTSDEFLSVDLIDDELNLDVQTLYLNEEYISFKLLKKHTLKIGKMVFIEVNVHDEFFEIEGNVHMLTKSNNAYICVVHMHHTPHSSSIIQKYIATRQMQIIQELNKFSFSI